MHYIRPYHIFALWKEPAEKRVASIKIPEHYDARLLDTTLLITLMKIVGASRVFEFGTYTGSMALNLALNLIEGGKIFTLDWNTQGIQDRQVGVNNPSTGRTRLDFESSPAAPKIRRLMGDSTAFDFSAWEDSIDLCFVDGGHSLAVVESDTHNAFTMLNKKRLSCIAWHDYGNPDFPELSRYLERLSESRDIFQIGDTTLCVWFNDPEGIVASELAHAAQDADLMLSG